MGLSGSIAWPTYNFFPNGWNTESIIIFGKDICIPTLASLLHQYLQFIDDNVSML